MTLLETIPKVNAATTAQEYRTAINSMLTALNDKNTRAEITAVMKTSEQPKTEVKDFVRLENSILFVNPTQAVRTREQNQDKYFQTLQQITSLLTQAKSVVIDGRDTLDPSYISVYYYN